MDMNMNTLEMNDTMLEQANGGMKVTHPLRTTTTEKGLIHDDCGGTIENPLIGWAKCTQCGEEHWFLSDFKYHKE